MKNTKKLVALTLVAALSAMLLVAGCGKKEADVAVETEAVTEATETETTETEATETEAATEAATEETTEATAEGSKHVTITVVDNEQNETTYEANTDAEYLKEVFDEIDDLVVEGDDSEYGLYITTVNGLTADYNTDGAYWAIYVNDEYGMYGADQQPVTDGDAYKLVYEVSQ